MFEKLEDLAKNNKKISDFHIRSGSQLSYRQTGEIIMVKEVIIKEQAKDPGDILKILLKREVQIDQRLNSKENRKSKKSLGTKLKLVLFN